MPVLSVFYGLVIRMYCEKGGNHNAPHIHVVYQGSEYVIGLDGTLLSATDLPTSKRKLLDAWLIIHQDELYANWDLLSAGEPFLKIEPLR